MGININGNDFTDMARATDYFKKKREEYLKQNPDSFELIWSNEANSISLANLGRNRFCGILMEIDELIKKASAEGEFYCTFKKGEDLSVEEYESMKDILENFGYRLREATSGLIIKWDK